MKVLVLLATERAALADLEETLRAVAALVACGITTRLVEIGDGVGTLGADDLPDEAERIVEQLGALGVHVETLADEELADALLSADSVLRLAAPCRSGRPPLLVLDDAGEGAGLTHAGQVVRDASVHTRKP